MSATACVILDTRRMKMRTGKYPIKLRVTFQSKSKYYSTSIELTKEDYEKLAAPRISSELQVTREKIKEIQRSAEKAVLDIHPFSFTEFETDYIVGNAMINFKKAKQLESLIIKDEFDFMPFKKRFSIFGENHSMPGTISIVFQSYIKKLIREERIGSALNYQDTYNSIKNLGGMSDSLT